MGYPLLHRETYGAQRVTIYYDESPSSPREDDNLTVIYGPSSRYVGAIDRDVRGVYEGDFAWAEYAAELREDTDIIFLCGLRAVDYGANGSRYSLVDDLDRCDGLVTITRQRWAELHGGEITPEATREAAEGELETYQAWANGEVYGYVVETLETCNLGHVHSTNDEDSCWGFYDWKDALSEGRAAIEAETPTELPDYSNDGKED